MTDIAKVAIQADTTGLKKGETALKNFKAVGESTEKSIVKNTARMNAGFKAVTPAIQKTTATVSDSGDKMSAFGHKSRQASMQLSQVAQQASVTGNWLGALAIQLPDLMLGFGTLGILVGAAAGALGSYFVNSARDAENATEKLSEEIDELSGKYEELGIAQKELIRLKIADEAKAVAVENRKLQGVIDTSLFKLNRLNNEYARGRTDILEYTEQEKELRDAIAKSRSDMESNNKTLKDRNDLLNGAEAAEKAAADAATDARDARNRAESDALAVIQSKETPAERASREMAEQKTVLANAYTAEIIDFQAYKEAKARIDEEYIAGDLARTEAAEKQKIQMLSANQTAALGIVGGLFGQMAEIARNGGREQFQEYKNLASAQAAISTALAMTNALAVTPTPVGIALAGAVGVMGAAQIGMIQNQSYQGARAMGGQVEGGGRYLVGENGPEVLQLGSQGGNITPNHALEGGGASVTTVVNIQAGVTKAEVASLIPTIVSASTNAVKAELGKGGSMSKSVRLRA